MPGSAEQLAKSPAELLRANPFGAIIGGARDTVQPMVDPVMQMIQQLLGQQQQPDPNSMIWDPVSGMPVDRAQTMQGLRGRMAGAGRGDPMSGMGF